MFVFCYDLKIKIKEEQINFVYKLNCQIKF